MLFGKISILNIGGIMAYERNDYRLRPVEIPCDYEFYERPFFAYGLFKKGQLAHSKIADCIENSVPDDIPYELHIRDGYPLIKKIESEKITNGEKIIFNEKIICAYQIISNTHPGNIYKWDTVVIDGETFNILVTEDLHGTFRNVDENQDYLDSYDGHNDPFFFRVPEFICNELKNLDLEDRNAIFKIQMYYMLLWSAIERHNKLKYYVSNIENDYLRALADDEVYKEAFRIVDPKYRDPIRSAKNASTYYFDKNNQNFIINFYYTIRSNVVHRGKEPENNFDTLVESLEDLLKIYYIMIKKTFGDEEIESEGNSTIC